jgi:hypothetical protein
LAARWTFLKSGYPLRLDGDRGEYLEAYLQNSCTGLVEQTFLAQGYKEDAAFDQWQ